jgi:DeoR family fructose operon transcriptional repressor
VSEDTIRRDLRKLETSGLIRKTHGGAMQSVVTAPPYNTRLQQAPGVKEAIGRRAAELVQDGDTLIIDSGTTTLGLARALTVSRVTVVTNSLEIARVIAMNRDYELVLLGGKWDSVHHELVGPTTIEQLSRYRVDKVFMGMTALDRRNGITDLSEADATLKRAMIEVSQRVIALVDHSKIGRVAFCHVAPANSINLLVTDELADCAAFEDLNWEIIKVPVPAGEASPADGGSEQGAA